MTKGLVRASAPRVRRDGASRQSPWASSTRPVNDGSSRLADDAASHDRVAALVTAYGGRPLPRHCRSYVITSQLSAADQHRHLLRETPDHATPNQRVGGSIPSRRTISTGTGHCLPDLPNLRHPNSVARRSPAGQAPARKPASAFELIEAAREIFVHRSRLLLALILASWR